MNGEAEKREVTCCKGKRAMKKHRMVLMVEHWEFHGVELFVSLIIHSSQWDQNFV